LQEAEGLPCSGSEEQGMNKLLIPFLLSTPAWGQSVHMAAGTTSFQDQTAAGVTSYFDNQTIFLGGSNFGLGAFDQFKFKGLNWTVGDNNISYQTDGAGIAVSLRGLSIEKDGLGVFAGVSGIQYSLPFVPTLHAAYHPSAGLFYSKKLERWKLSSLQLYSKSKTAIESVKFDGKTLNVYVVGGLLENKWQLGGTFVFRPTSYLALAGNHQTQKNNENTALSITSQHAWFQAHATALQDRYFDKTSNGLTLGVGETWRWLQVRSEYYNSNHHQFILNGLQEQFQHWSFNESINNANSFNEGVAYRTNRTSLSFSHTIQFLPTRGFVQVLTVGIAFHLHDTVIQTQSYLLPGHQFKYLAGIDQWAAGPIQSTGNSNHRYNSIGKNLIQGIVVREDGTPVEGIAVLIGQELVYSNAAGIYALRTKKAVELPVSVDLKESLAPGDWTVISCEPTKIILKQQ
jgi:hypothetical protein